MLLRLQMNNKQHSSFLGISNHQTVFIALNCFEVINKMSSILHIELQTFNSNNKKIMNEQTLNDILSTDTLPNKRLMDLQGQCRIQNFVALQIDWIKSILLIIPIIASGICLLLLKYYKSLRVKVFYKQTSLQDATHFYIKSYDQHEQIEPVIKTETTTYVYFKSLKYKLTNRKLCPVGFQFQELFEHLQDKSYLDAGIQESTLANKQKVYGLNEHKVDIPNYFEYMFDVLTKPFFLLQYIICIILIFENLITFVILYFCFSFFTTTVNYVLLYVSFLKIRDMAEKEYQIQVIRGGVTQTIKSHQLVPGDVVIPQIDQEVCYDGILLQGEAFVNEASLTGQSIPVGKFVALDVQATNQQNTWLFEGSKVLETRENSRVIVINTGYSTRRGRIIRKILSRNTKMPQFFMTAIAFLFETLLVGTILYLATLPLMLGKVMNTFVFYRFLDVLGWAFPPSLPIYFNFAFTFSLFRLKRQNIFGTQPEKTTEAANIRTFCFDKTGTLTQNQIQIYQIQKFKSQDVHQKITDKVEDPSNSLIFKLFAACHAVREVHGEHLGDQVDLRMYLKSGYKMRVPQCGDVRFVAQNDKGETLQILRINQFQSKFQNMSVLAKDTKQNKYYAFIKGAPERIDRNSTFKFKEYQNMVASYSLGGYRTIGYGYKEIAPDQLKTYLEGEREIYEADIKALGLIAFENKLKSDTRETIDRLVESDIEPKMITGDNIYIAVQTGYRAGILRPNEKVLLLQGRKQQKIDSNDRIFNAIYIQKKGDQIIKKPFQLKEQDDYLNQTQYALAIDNDFLMMKPEPVLTRSTKLFARISPQNKAKIVKLYIAQEKIEYGNKSRCDRVFGLGRWKVGMCGDGANDLMAIREADVGVGISDSDASYGASFTITKMLDVDLIVRQSKNTSQGIVDLVRYVGSVSFLKIITSIILVSDVTYFSPMAMIYFNFAHSMFLSAFIVLSSPSDAPTKRRPNNNILSLDNHIIYWSNVIFPTMGFVGGYLYLKYSDVFIANPKPIVTEIGYVGFRCQTQTIVFLMINIPLIMNAFVCFTSEPFRKRIYQNLVLFITIVCNIIAAIVIFFFPTGFPLNFGFVAIPTQEAGIVLLIISVSIILCYIVVQFYQRKCMQN